MLVAARPSRLAGALIVALLAFGPAVAAPTAAPVIDTIVTGSLDTPATAVDQPTPVALPTKASDAFVKALATLATGDHTGAYELAKGLPDSTERRTIQWAAIYFGNGDINSSSILNFEADAPGFSATPVFHTRLEQALLREKPAAADTVRLLGGEMPNTLSAQIMLAQAYLADGQKTRAARIAHSIWVDNYLDKDTEAEVLDKLGSLLTRADHWARAMHLMMNDRATGVERLMTFMTPAQKSLAVARNAVSRNDKDAKKLLDAVDPSMHGNPVYLFSRAQRARQFELWDDAITYLNKVKGDVPDSEDFWYERLGLARQLLALGEVRRAYDAAAGYTTGPEGRLVEARFHSGWIALAFLHDAKLALPHFEKMKKLATLPDTVTQADYWLGRTEAALGDTKAANAAYKSAAQYGTIYYGQLARQALGETSVELRAMPSTASVVTQFESRELVKAVHLLADNGHKEMAVPLLSMFATTFKDGGELLLAARLAQDIDAHHLAIDVADTADKRGTPLDLFNFPKDGLPQTQLASIDKAAIYAIARQESHFRADAVSRSGALGLMQLMPATAKETAGKLGVKYSASKLSDPEYNALLGSTYLKAQLDRFDGSLLLAAAAYNAGAGNARKWMATFGDPRSDTIDPVVWVELIPVTETRKYVQKVLGNYLVYRARLGQTEISTEDALRHIPG